MSLEPYYTGKLSPNADQGLLAIIHIIISSGAVASGTIDASIIVGMVVAGCIPTTIASNVVMTRNAGGDEAAAIIEVVIGNVLGSIISPWLIYGFIPRTPEFVSFQPAPPNNLGPMYRNVMMQLGLAVLSPLVVGQLLRWIWPRRVTWALGTFYLAQFCSVLLIMVAWYVLSPLLSCEQRLKQSLIGRHFPEHSRQARCMHCRLRPSYSTYSSTLPSICSSRLSASTSPILRNG